MKSMKKLFCLLLFVCLGLFVTGCKSMDPVYEDENMRFTVEVNDRDFQLNSLRQLINVTTHDGKPIAPQDIHISGNVDVTTPGTYPVIVVAYDQLRHKDQTIEVVVADTRAPQFHVVDETIKLFKKTSFDPDPKTNLLFAYDEVDGDVTDKIQWEGEVNSSKVGVYPVTYTVSDSAGNTSSVTIQYEVTNTRNEFLLYLYHRTIDFYWGRYFLTDETGKILNYDDALYYEFTNAGTAQFERACGLQTNTDGVESGILLERREDGVYVSEEKSIPVNNYRNVEFFISKESGRLVEYVAEVHYEIEGKKDLVLKHEFSMKKVSGKYYVEYFLLPNS